MEQSECFCTEQFEKVNLEDTKLNRQQKCLSSRRHVWDFSYKTYQNTSSNMGWFLLESFLDMLKHCGFVGSNFVGVTSATFFVSAILTPDFTRFDVRTAQFLSQCKVRGMPMVTT